MAFGHPNHPRSALSSPDSGQSRAFHRTINGEATSRGQSLRAPDVPSARVLYEPLVQSYNWVRPHEELEMKTPGQVYCASARARPSTLPAHQLPEGVAKRRVCAAGLVSWQGRESARWQSSGGSVGECGRTRERMAVWFCQTRRQKAGQKRGKTVNVVLSECVKDVLSSYTGREKEPLAGDFGFQELSL